MEIVHVIILLISTILPFLGMAFTFVSKYFKSLKAKTALEGLMEISKTIKEVIVEAESLAGYSGTEKKEYVLSCAKNFAVEKRIPFDEKVAVKTIEEFIQFSKNVNQKTKKAIKKSKEAIING